MRKFYFPLATFLLISIFGFKSVYATNFLQNPGFEEDVAGWTSVSTIILSTISDPVPHSGNKALKIENKSSGTTSLGAEQEVTDITANGQYLISGFVLFGDPNVKEAKIRVAWYKSGETSQFDFVDTNILSSPTGSWTELSKIIKAPAEAVRAEVRLVISKKTKDPAVAYFDEIFFQPDYTPDPTPTPTQTKTSTPTKIPTISTTANTPKSPSVTPTTVPKNLTSNAVFSTAQPVLSSATESANINLTASDSASSSITLPENTNRKFSLNAIIFLVIGGGFLILAGLLYYLRIRQS